MTGTGTVIVNLPASAAQDLAGNPNTASTSTDNSVGFDPVAPVVTGIVRADPSPTSTASVHFTVTFSKNVSGVDASDFTLTTTGVTGAAITGITGSGTTWTVTVNTGAGDGTLRMDLIDNDTIVDGAGNPLGGKGAGNGNFTSGEVYTIDKTAPSVLSIVRASANPTNAATVVFNVTFSEVVTGVDTGDFSLASSGVAGAAISGITGSGATRTVAVSTGSGSGTIGLNLVDNDTIVDGIGTPLGGTGAGNGNVTGPVSTIDKTAPQAGNLVAANITTGGGSTQTFTIVFSDNLAIDRASLDGSDIRVTGPGGFNQPAALVSVTPATNGTPRTATYRITAPGGSWDTTDTGTYTVALQANQVRDTAGNRGAGSTLGMFSVNVSVSRHTVFLPLVLRPGTPDLVISLSISPNKRTFTAGEPVVVSLTVTNRGDAAAGPFWVDLYINPSSRPTAANQIWNTRCGLTPCFGIVWEVPSGLAPGQSVTRSSQRVPAGYSIWPGWLAAGTSDLYAYADSFSPSVALGDRAGGDEANNRAELRGLRVTGSNPALVGVQGVKDRPSRPVHPRK